MPRIFAPIAFAITGLYANMSSAALCFETMTGNSVDALAHRAGKTVIAKSSRLDIEIGGAIYRNLDTGEYRADCQIQTGLQKQLSVSLKHDMNKEVWVAIWHTHGARSSHTKFSKTDIALAESRGVAIFLTVDRRTTRRHQPSPTSTENIAIR